MLSNLKFVLNNNNNDKIKSPIITSALNKYKIDFSPEAIEEGRKGQKKKKKERRHVLM